MTIKYKKGFKYQLAETHACVVDIHPFAEIDTDFIRLTPEGTLTLRKGYAWDGPSGPTFDTKTFMRGSLVHDALYQLIRMRLLPRSSKEAADDELYDICISVGMWKMRAKWVFTALRLGGRRATLPENQKAVHEAP